MSAVAAASLTDVEQKALLAVLRLHPDGYGVTIRDEITETLRPISFGEVYATLTDLAAKGYVESREGEGTAERGGRPKLHFTITDSGRAALRA